MNFQPIRYMQWAKRTHDVAPRAFNLATSAVDPAPADLLGPLEGLPIRGNNAYGHAGLRATLAARYRVPEVRVLCSVAGASMANFLLAAALASGPGATALVEWPCYEPLWRVFEAAGARLEWLPRRVADRCALDLDRVEAAFARGARVLVLSNLMNPCGTILPRAAVRAAGAIAARHGGHIVVDEIYLDGAFDHPEARSAAGAGDDADGVIVTSSLTKVYGLGGLRAGWAIAPAPLVARAYDILDHIGVEMPFIADEVALRALERLPALRARAERVQRENLPRLRRFAAGRSDLSLVEPDGGFVAWIRLGGGWTSPALEVALRAADVAVAPGHFFGAPDHIRVGFGGPAAALEEGLRRLGTVLDRPPESPA